MVTPLDKTLKREIVIDGQHFIVAISAEGLKITVKGRRNGLELTWQGLINGDAELASALKGSVQRVGAPDESGSEDEE